MWKRESYESDWVDFENFKKFRIKSEFKSEVK